VVVIPRARGKVLIEVSQGLRDRIKELSQKYGVLYESLLSEALNLYTLSKEGLPTQSKGLQSDAILVSIRVVKEDYMWWTIRVGEGFNTIEISLNNIQLRKLCQTKLLAKEVCEKIDLSKL
jgi:hypothetical protein